MAHGRTRPGPSHTAARVGVPKIHKVLLLDLRWALTAVRRAQMPDVAAGYDVWIAGTFHDWLMGVNGQTRECFLNAFSSEVVHLPCLQQNPCSYNCLDESGTCSASPKEILSWVVLRNALLSASPSSGSKYIVAALCYYHIAEPGLALWQPGMTTWCLYRNAQIDYTMGNLAIYEGKLYVVSRYASNTTEIIFSFELREDELGVSLSCPDQYKIDRLITPSNSTRRNRCNMVVWRGKLLLIIRYFGDCTYKRMICKPLKVEVFALDFSTHPCGFTEIQNFDGDCIFVSSASQIQ